MGTGFASPSCPRSSAGKTTSPVKQSPGSGSGRTASLCARRSLFSHSRFKVAPACHHRPTEPGNAARQTQLGVAPSTGASPGSLPKGLGNLSLQNDITDCFQPPWVVFFPAESASDRLIQSWLFGDCSAPGLAKGEARHGAARCSCSAGQP